LLQEVAAFIENGRRSLAPGRARLRSVPGQRVGHVDLAANVLDVEGDVSSGKMRINKIT
jgi:hypothetical protein